MKGIFPFYKPVGISSCEVIRRIKKNIGEEKIGHGGTLDPMASGVLVVAIGREYTKKISHFLNGEKEYEAVIELGYKSSTDDKEGKIEKISDKKPTLKEVENAVSNFCGEIMQLPPRYSAIKIKGKRAYALARQGIEFDLLPRKVKVKKINILQYKYPELKINIVTGAGVYVRSIARDIGIVLKTGGYLKKLKRTRVGNLTITKSIKKI